MTPVPVGDESMPKFLTATNGNYAAPVMLVTGEINGHGGALFLMPCMETARCPARCDVVESSGAGGVSFVDIIDLTTAGTPVANRFAVPVNLVSTNEIGAYEDGSAGQPIAIGHAEGVTVSGNHPVPGRRPARRERVAHRQRPDADRQPAPGGQHAAERVPHGCRAADAARLQGGLWQLTRTTPT